MYTIAIIIATLVIENLIFWLIDRYRDSYIPKTVEGAVNSLLKGMHSDMKAYIKSGGEISTSLLPLPQMVLFAPQLRRDAYEKYGLTHCDDIANLIRSKLCERIRK